MTTIARTPAHLGGSGTPLVLLHGIEMSWSAWSPVIPLLEQHHTVYAPTLAGHRGGPALAADSVGIAPIADALEQQLDELGWERAHFAGNSLGGALAVEMAQRGRAESVVAFSPGGAYSGWWAKRRLKFLLHLLQALGGLPGVEYLVRFRIVRWVFARIISAYPLRLSAEQALDALHDLQACTALDGIVAGVDADGPMTFAVADDLPIRIAWAKRDRLIPWRSYGKPFCAMFPSADVLILDGVGHVPMDDDPELVAETILAVTSTGLPASGRDEKAS
jgi:pimeloyl-ACP methyl ester carboxylesterase